VRAGPFDIWEFARGCDRRRAAGAAEARSVAPRFRATLLRSHGDAVVVQVAGGQGPSGDRSAIFYLERRGFFELARREEWPSPPGQYGTSVLLMLTACPAA